MNTTLNKFVKGFIDVAFIIGIMLELAVPFTLKPAVKLTMKVLGAETEYAKILDHYTYAVVSIMLVGLCSLLILFELKKMMKTVIDDDCFVLSNVKSLSRMATYAFAVTFFKLLRCAVYFTPAAIIVAGVFAFAGLLSKVLAMVFEKAVNYKLENDLTI